MRSLKDKIKKKEIEKWRKKIEVVEQRLTGSKVIESMHNISIPGLLFALHFR